MLRPTRTCLIKAFIKADVTMTAHCMPPLIPILSSFITTVLGSVKEFIVSSPIAECTVVSPPPTECLQHLRGIILDHKFDETNAAEPPWLQ